MHTSAAQESALRRQASHPASPLAVGVVLVLVLAAGSASAQPATLHPRLRIATDAVCARSLVQCAPLRAARIRAAGAHAAPLLLATAKQAAPHHQARQRLARMWTITFPPSADDAVKYAALADALRATGELADVAVDDVGRGAASPPNDPGFPDQWGLFQADGPDVRALDAWDITTGSPSVVIAIVDTGVDPDHPDLAGKLLPGYDFVDNDAQTIDDYGHGTLLAGVAAASTDDAFGVAGMCPDCSILPVKVLNSQNYGYFSWWAAGIVYAVDHGADVLNLSLGGATYDAAVHDAVTYAVDHGVIVVSTMMNEGNNVVFYPGAFEETIAVGATGNDDARAATFWWGGGSNYGPHIDLVAPGVDILGPVPGGGLEAWSGTSISTAFVSGVAGLMRTLDSDITTEQVRTILQSTARDEVGSRDEDTPGFDIYYGHGSLDAAAALAVLAVADFDDDGVPDVDDCAAGDPDVFPGAVEVLGNGVDDDCDPATRDFDPPVVCPDAGCDGADDIAPSTKVDSADALGVHDAPGADPYDRLPREEGCCAVVQRVPAPPPWPALGLLVGLIGLGARRRRRALPRAGASAPTRPGRSGTSTVRR